MADSFKFELVSPERLLISEDAVSVQVPGIEGEFTVMPGHQPMLTPLKPGLLDIKLASGQQLRYFVRGGFSETLPGSLTVLAETAINRDELEASMLAQAIRDAEEDVGDAGEDFLKRDKALLHLEYLRQVQVTLQFQG